MAIGDMSGFRLPGMIDDINIEEIIAQSKRAPAKPKPKTKAKAKPVVKAKAKPKPPTKPRPTVSKAAVMRGMEDIGGPRQPRLKVRPRPSPVKVPTRPKVSGEDLMKVSSQTKGRPNIPNVGTSSVMPGANINIQEIIEQATRGGSTAPATQGSSTAPAQKTQTDYKETIKFEGSMDGTTDRDISKMTWEEIDKEMNDIRFASRSTWNPAARNNPLPERYQQLQAQYESIAPISRLEKDYDLAGYNESHGDNVGEGYLEEGERLRKLIESRRGPQDSQQPSSGDASTMETLKEFFEKMKSQQEQQQPQQPQMPQQPKPIPQWDIMGGPGSGPIVAPGFPERPPRGPWMPSPRPPTTNQMFGGYGGTAPIVPAMAYAGLGNFPQPPQMPAPQYDPDAEPGGPPMPTGPVFGGKGDVLGGRKTGWETGPVDMDNSTRTLSREELEKWQSGKF